jgi:hypothetical protein
VTLNSDSVKLKEISEHLGKTITENPYAVGTLILLETGVIIVLFSAYNSLTNPSDFGSVRESLKTVSTRSSLHFTLMQG